jgi:hypothetical protein
MNTKDLDDKLLNVFKDCPYKGKHNIASIKLAIIRNFAQGRIGGRF